MDRELTVAETGAVADAGRDADGGGGEGRRLTAVEFQGLADIPPEIEWAANIRNAHTRRAYQRDVREFCRFVGIRAVAELRQVTRAHVIAWRRTLDARALAGATVRRKLSALAALYDYLCEQNAVADNPVRGVQRPPAASGEGATPALGDAQARALLDAPPADTLKGLRDRAILATLLYHGLRRAELAALRVGDLQPRQGVLHLRVHGKRGKIRYVPAAPAALERIDAWLAAAGHGGHGGHAGDPDAPLFHALTRRPGPLRALHPNTINCAIVQVYGRRVGLGDIVTAHGLRATAATNALDHDADIAKVQEWLGHANISTTRLYDRRNTRAADSPTYRVKY